VFDIGGVLVRIHHNIASALESTGWGGERIELKDLGALSVVQDVRAQGIEAAVLSNTCSRHWEVLSQLPAVSDACREHCFLSFEMGVEI
jgi:hypothetical protein